MAAKPHRMKALELLRALAESGKSAVAGNPGDMRTWQLDALAALRRLFGEGAPQLDSFKNVRWTPHYHFGGVDNSAAYEAAYRRGLGHSVAVLESALKEAEHFGDCPESDGAHALLRLERLCDRFHVVAR